MLSLPDPIMHNPFMQPATRQIDEQPTTRRAPAVPRGVITLVSGCMFSGKTTEFIRRLEPCDPARVRVFKHVIDRRYAGDAVVSHGGLARPATAIARAADMVPFAAAGMTIALDEAHFFDADLPRVTDYLARCGVDVMLTMLDRDSWGHPFPIGPELERLADESIILAARCARCGRSADRTQRLTPIVDGQMVGGSESYEPRCDDCWHPPPEPPC